MSYYRNKKLGHEGRGHKNREHSQHIRDYEQYRIKTSIKEQKEIKREQKIQQKKAERQVGRYYRLKNEIDQHILDYRKHLNRIKAQQWKANNPKDYKALEPKQHVKDFKQYLKSLESESERRYKDYQSRYHKEYRKKDPINKKPQSVRFQLTAEKINDLITAQGGVCANPYCQGVNENGRRLSIDHNHTTGQMREFLCHHCNVSLGYVREDPKKALGIALYLYKHSPLKDQIEFLRGIEDFTDRLGIQIFDY